VLLQPFKLAVCVEYATEACVEEKHLLEQVLLKFLNVDLEEIEVHDHFELL